MSTNEQGGAISNGEISVITRWECSSQTHNTAVDLARELQLHLQSMCGLPVKVHILKPSRNDGFFILESEHDSSYAKDFSDITLRPFTARKIF